MFSCPICGVVNVPSLSMLLSHIRIVHSSEPGFSIQCNLQGCRRTFKKFTTFRNHTYNFHGWATETDRVGPDASPDTSFNAIVTSDSEGSSDEEEGNEMELSTPCITGEQIKRSAALWILKTKECHRITQSVMESMLPEITGFFHECLQGISLHVKKTLRDAKVDDDTTQSALAHLSESSPFCNPFNDLYTHHRQLNYYRKNFNLVEPTSIVLGTKLKHKGCGSKRRLVDEEETMVYVPILKTLQNLLNNEAVMAEINHGHSRDEPGLLSDYCDADAFQVHPLYSVNSKALQIHFYYDEVEVCNPIGSHKKIHKLGAFYFQLGNLSPKYRSAYKAIQLLALCKVKYISKYSLDAILGYIGSIALVSADNPASSALGGFKESSSARRLCRHCSGTYDDISVKFCESEYTLRSLDEHLKQCDTLEQSETQAQRTEHSKEFGVNHRSILLELKYFDLCSRVLLPDPMHDLLEGILQYEAKLILHHCILGKKYLSFSEFSDILECVELGYMESDDRPSPITRAMLTGTEKNLGQKAAQMGLLGRLLPYLMARYIPAEDEHWKNYLLLLQIVDLILAPEILQDEIAYLQRLIDEHHTNFVKLYPSATVTPKMHYLIHVPRLIALLGPLVRYWTMRYEAKHNFLKKLAQNIGNFINIAWTLAQRHQQWQCYQWLNSTSIVHDEPEIGPGEEVAERDRPVELQSCISVYRCRWVKVDGITYKKSCAIILGVQNDYPIFGKVKATYVIDSNRIAAHVMVLNTIEWNEHLHLYRVEPSTTHKVVLLNMLLNPFPLHIRRHSIGQTIIVKHHIAGSL